MFDIVDQWDANYINSFSIDELIDLTEAADYLNI